MSRFKEVRRTEIKKGVSPRTWGRLIEAWRIYGNITREEAAECFGVHKQTWVMWASGKCVPDKEIHLKRLYTNLCQNVKYFEEWFPYTCYYGSPAMAICYIQYALSKALQSRLQADESVTTYDYYLEEKGE